jgi:hypothetical protein
MATEPSNWSLRAGKAGAAIQIFLRHANKDWIASLRSQ